MARHISMPVYVNKVAQYKAFCGSSRYREKSDKLSLVISLESVSAEAGGNNSLGLWS